MLPSEYLKRLRQVEVRARLVSEQLMGGRLTSVFKGRGMDIASPTSLSLLAYLR
jgi:hypothetical protein